MYTHVHTYHTHTPYTPCTLHTQTYTQAYTDVHACVHLHTHVHTDTRLKQTKERSSQYITHTSHRREPQWGHVESSSMRYNAHKQLLRELKGGNMKADILEAHCYVVDN